jgi:hypothetical protein
MINFGFIHCNIRFSTSKLIYILFILLSIAVFGCKSNQNKPNDPNESTKKEPLRSNIPEFTSSKDTEKRLTPHYDELKKLDKTIDKKGKP